MNITTDLYQQQRTPESSHTPSKVQKLNGRQNGGRHPKIPLEFQSWKVFPVNAVRNWSDLFAAGRENK